MSEIREELEHFAKLAEEKQSSKETFQSEKLPDNNSFQEIKTYTKTAFGDQAFHRAFDLRNQQIDRTGQYQQHYDHSQHDGQCSAQTRLFDER